MKDIIKQLGITPGPWGGRINYIPYFNDFCEVSIPNGPVLSLSPAKQNEGNSRAIRVVPEMLSLMIEGIIQYEQHFEESEHNNLILRQKEAVQKATGKPWEEIKGLIHG